MTSPVPQSHSQSFYLIKSFSKQTVCVLAGNSIWCPEYDTYEGNKFTMAGTLHTCDGGNGYWNSCDRSGCQTNVYNLDSNVMCPESRCKINTNNWYQLVHYQNRDTATIYMEQDGERLYVVYHDEGCRCRERVPV